MWKFLFIVLLHTWISQLIDRANLQDRKFQSGTHSWGKFTLMYFGNNILTSTPLSVKLGEVIKVVESINFEVPLAMSCCSLKACFWGVIFFFSVLIKLLLERLKNSSSWIVWSSDFESLKIQEIFCWGDSRFKIYWKE